MFLKVSSPRKLNYDMTLNPNDWHVRLPHDTPDTYSRNQIEASATLRFASVPSWTVHSTPC